MDKYRLERQHIIEEKQLLERGRSSVSLPLALPAPGSMLSRWHAAAAGWSPGGDASPTSPTLAAASWLVRPLSRPRLRRLLLLLASIVLVSVCLFHWSERPGQLLAVDGVHLPWSTASHPASKEKPTTPTVTTDETNLVSITSNAKMPHVPAKIWQIYLDFTPSSISVTYLNSWLSRSPSWAYTLLDASGALVLVKRLAQLAAVPEARHVPLYPDTFHQRPVPAADKKKGDAASPSALPPPASTLVMADLSFAKDAVEQYTAMPRRVLRADFLRYLLLAMEGGVYSDTDTQLVRPMSDWVPAAFRQDTRLIVGLEADASPPVHGTTYEVQFCQWTLASAPNHPTLWTMLDRILASVRTLPSGKLSDDDVLGITGPAAWTEVVFEHLNQVAGTGVGKERITWKTLTGMTEPRLYGDTLVLPIDGFATGVPHSHASHSGSEQTLVKHQFQGHWRDDKG